MNIYVGNLSHELTEGELRNEFETFGQVASVNIVKDRYTGDPRGFGFVEMPVKGEAQAAITSLGGKELKGRTLRVNESRPPAAGGRGGARQGGGYGGGRRRSW